MLNLKGKKIHFIGIGGVGVNALAKYAFDCGAAVTGSDAKLSDMCQKISRLGAKVYEGVNPQIVSDADAVVYSSAIKEDNEELICARKEGIRVFERHEFLSEVARSFENVVGIAGTHGKTTTTAMLAHILACMNKNFAGMIGGDSVDYGNYVNNSRGSNDIFIVEACEYKRSFLSLNPTVAVVTNVECDHPDCYTDYASVKHAFDEYLSGARSKIYLKSDSEKRWKIISFHDGKTEEYSGVIESGKCKLYIDGEFTANIELRDGGNYNFKNASFAIAAANILGVNTIDSAIALKSFNGVSRRFEFAGMIDGIPVRFDFAHHPTEIKCVLARAAEYGKILAVFQPHTYSRTKAYFDDFVEVFGNSNEIGALAFIPTYAAREKFDADFEVDSLARKILSEYGKRAYVTKSQKQIIDYVNAVAKDYDIVLFIGAGDIYDLKRLLDYDA